MSRMTSGVLGPTWLPYSQLLLLLTYYHLSPLHVCYVNLLGACQFELVKNILDECIHPLICYVQSSIYIICILVVHISVGLRIYVDIHVPCFWFHFSAKATINLFSLLSYKLPDFQPAST